jgi:hypothetical protein
MGIPNDFPRGKAFAKILKHGADQDPGGSLQFDRLVVVRTAISYFLGKELNEIQDPQYREVGA